MVRSILSRFAASLPVTSAVALAAALAAPAQAAPTFVNGDFSTFNAGTSTVDRMTNSNTSGWTTDSGYSFIINSNQAVNGFYYQSGGEKLQLWSQGSSPTGNGGLVGTITAAPSPAGGNFLAADSMYQNPTGVILQQTVTGLTIGTTYNVSFFQAAGQQTGWTGDTSDTWSVKFGNVTKVAPTMSNPSKNFTSWSQVTLSFVADATSMAMQFLLSGTSPGGVQQPPFALLDGITVSQTTTVPEPATAALLLAGVAGLAGFGRRRARAG